MPKPVTKHKVDPAAALALWNGGKTLDQIGAHFGVSRYSARWAIRKAELQGLGTARRRKPRPSEEEPPLWEFLTWPAEQ